LLLCAANAGDAMLTAAIAAARIAFERFAMMVSFPVSEWPTRRLPCYPMHRGLDYIAANSITLSRGAADCGEHRQAAAAIASVIASALLRQCGHSVVSLVSPNEFFSTWCRLAHFPEYFFNLAKSSRASLNKDEARRILRSCRSFCGSRNRLVPSEPCWRR
jgi:hypothetical protein